MVAKNIEKGGFFADWSDDDFENLMVETALARVRAFMPNPPFLTNYFFNHIDNYVRREICGIRTHYEVTLTEVED